MDRVDEATRFAHENGRIERFFSPSGDARTLWTGPRPHVVFLFLFLPGVNLFKMGAETARSPPNAMLRASLCPSASLLLRLRACACVRALFFAFCCLHARRGVFQYMHILDYGGGVMLSMEVRVVFFFLLLKEYDKYSRSMLFALCGPFGPICFFIYFSVYPCLGKVIL